MTALLLPIGLLPPLVAGWLLVRAMEGRTLVLRNIERAALGLLLGIVGMTFGVFLLHRWLGMAIDLPTFALSLLLLGGVPGLWLWLKRGEPSTPSPTPPAASPLVGRMRWAAIALGVWTLLKIVVTSTTFLALTPTYLDDTLDNWNLRGKVFYEDKALTLVMPNEDPLTSPRGVSSYPPTVPLAKAWLAQFGGWSDPLVNSIHVAWYAIALILVFSTLLRLHGRNAALFGTYLLASLPLYLMHGTNPYADCFLSAHVLAAAAMLLSAWLETDGQRAAAFLRLAGICMAVLPFTKNEGLLIYLPPLVLLALLALRKKRNLLGQRAMLATLAMSCLALLAVAGPWLAFKWLNGLTFGNAKPFSTLDIAWHPDAANAVAVNTLLEGNWLLLFPLVFALLIWKRRAAFGPYLPLTLFFLVVYVGQMMLYFFTSLSVEAVLQTGYARGVVHLSPVIVLLVSGLMWERRSVEH
jgi:hypothetical protein